MTDHDLKGFITIREAMALARKARFKRSLIWWRMMAYGNEQTIRTVRTIVNGRATCFISKKELNRVIRQKPSLILKAVVLTFILSCLLAKLCFAETASWYSSESACGPKTNNLPGCPTASGKGLYELEDKRTLFCAASKAFRMGELLKVTNRSNRRSVVVKVVDRGSFTKRYGRTLDLGRLAFSKIADPKEGVIHVSVEVV